MRFELLGVLGEGLERLIVIERRGKTASAKGDALHFRIDPRQVHLFDSAGKRIPGL